MEKKPRQSGNMKNSCLYECTVMHYRLEPKKNRFQYKTFMFSLDLDEIDRITRKNLFISRNSFNLFNFRDRDHIQMVPKGNVKEQVLHYLDQNGVDRNAISRIQLVTNLCTMGYQFNPVSFYFCFDALDRPVCTVVEVCNTFGELKPYLLDQSTFVDRRFDSQVKKNFYVSPFIDLDTEFHFNLLVPGEKLHIRINDHRLGKKFFLSTLDGKRKAITQRSVLFHALRFPFITVQVITLIYWQAFKLWIKKTEYHKKAANVHLQQGVLKPHKSITQ